MKHFSCPQAVMTALLSALFAIAAESAEPLYKSDFTKYAEGWRGWSATSPVVLAIVTDPDLKGQALELTTKDAKGWNVPEVKFKPFAVTDKTVIKFQVCADVPSNNELTFFNETEGSEYSVWFPTTADKKWITVQKYIGKAKHKRNAKPGITPDGMIGDQMFGLRIATRGERVRVANVEIFEADDANLPELP